MESNDLQPSALMQREYSPEYLSRDSWIRNLGRRDYRTRASVDAFNAFFAGLADDARCISVGGGPARDHHRLVNVNIGPFPNVDIVGDAHRLPLADGSVDRVYSQAVLEHLHTPALAVREMHRVLKPDGRLFACTPFMQPYHGYPHHYQNFTLTGHRTLFEQAGFHIVDAGVCVGPMFTLRHVVDVFLTTYLPRPMNRVGHLVWSGLSLLLAPLDLRLAKHRDAHVLASTTYLVAVKQVRAPDDLR